MRFSQSNNNKNDKRKQSIVNNLSKMKRGYDLNIVLISAATVLLVSSSINNGNYCSAYMSPPQHNHQFRYNNYDTSAFKIIRQGSSSSSTKKSTSSQQFELNASSRRPVNSNQESWSKRASVDTDIDVADPSTANGKRSGSRIGVRRRVRSVLEKAKGRTGIRNNSEDFLGSSPPQPLKTTSTVSNVVADAASIGGLGAVVVDEESGKIDVALDYVAPRKEEKNEKKNGEMVKNTETPVKKKSSPASTPSPAPAITRPKPRAEDILVPAKPTKSAVSVQSSANDQSPSKSPSQPSTSATIPEIEALKGDASAAFSMPPPPLPFTLPTLNAKQNNQLANGERVEFQTDMGIEGSGFVAVDVKAPAAVIWECLLDFYAYPETIPTVRDIQMFTNTHLSNDYYAETAVDRNKYEDGTLATLKHGIPSVTRASFSLSKFRLKIAAIHKYRTHPQGDYMIFTLDPACTNVVLQNAKGVWHTQSNPDGRGEVRITLLKTAYHLQFF
jgi:hypothetical protein